MSSGMRIIVAEDEQEFNLRAASLVVETLESLEKPLVTFPTGMTPLGMYRALVAEYRDRPLWRTLRFVGLDEYAGLPPDDPRLFSLWVAKECLDPLSVPLENRMCFVSNASDIDAEARRMNEWLLIHGPLDLAVVGIGSNGHIAFNEPGTAFESGVHALALTPESIRSNARYWGGEDHVPRHGITLGLANLAAARHTIVLASGAGKSDILARALTGPVTVDVPASYLQTISNVTILADKAAAQYII